MDDLEFLAQELSQPPLVKEKGRPQAHLPLSQSDLALAARLPNSSEYDLILRIFEGELQKLETEHMQSYRDKETFERTGLIAVSGRLLFERLQNEINFHSSEFRGELEAALAEKDSETMTPEEFIKKGFGME